MFEIFIVFAVVIDTSFRVKLNRLEAIRKETAGKPDIH